MWRSHSALAVFLIGTVVCGCAERKVDVEDTEEQKNQQILATYSHLTKFFDDCVERAARRRLASSGDVGAAIEQGFGACKAEESAVTQANVKEMEMKKSNNEDMVVGRLLGLQRGYGQSLGLDDAWAARVIEAVGNYGEMYERDLGSGSVMKLPRGANNLWTQSGLMYALPIR